uniref:FMRFamide-related neuropeptides n=1 Tax=Rhabditophanes sp. KR3021 TaxID=114890 RepID=A0AC35U154_9BILA
MFFRFNRDQRGGQKLIRFGRAGQKLIRFGRSGRFQGFGDQTEDERQPYEQTYYNPFSTFKRGGQKLIRFG